LPSGVIEGDQLLEMANRRQHHIGVAEPDETGAPDDAQHVWHLQGQHT
jgi:hypothetical protein